MWSGIAKAKSLKKVANYGGHCVDGSSEFELTEGEFRDGCFDVVHSRVRNIYVKLAFHFRG